MIKVQSLAFVGIPVTDMERARKFYEGVLGLKETTRFRNGQWIEYGVGQDTIAIANVDTGWLPSDQGTGVALEMENFDEAIRQLREADVIFAHDPFETPCCHMAIVQDPDGNKLMIHKLKPGGEKEPCP